MVSIKITNIPKMINLENEVWSVIPGYNGRYEISTLGRVKSNFGKAVHLIAQGVTKVGYAKVRLCMKGVDKTVSTHRLVAEAFLVNPNNLPEINHKDGNKLNNHVSNLEWCTRGENLDHAFELGLTKYPRKPKVIKVPKTKMPKAEPKGRNPKYIQAEDVISIRRMLSNGFDATFIARLMGCSLGEVYNFRDGELPAYFFKFMGIKKPYPKIPPVQPPNYNI